MWQPAWRRAGRALLLAVPPLLAGALVWSARPELAALVRMRAGAGLLLAAGVGLLLLPCADRDLVVSSRREARLWQAQATAGGVLMGVAAAVAAAGLKHGQAAGAAAWLAALALGACVCAAPVFYRIPWRALAGAALIAGAIALG